MKKLVRIDPDNGRFIDIDPNKLSRQAKALQHYIERKVDPASDDLGIYSELLPLCKKAIDQHLDKAVPLQDLPLRYPFREGLLPAELDALYAEFSATITGTPLDAVSIIEVNGDPCVEIEFED